jgi:hypothetical protein
MDENDKELLPNLKSTGMIAVGICVVLILLVILQHNLSFQKSGTIILPAGGTYLGPTSAPATEAPVAVIPTSTVPVVPAKRDASWVTMKGNKYPYSFQVPSTVKLVPLSKDQYDIYAISVNNQPPDSNVLIGVDDLRRTDALKRYISISKRTYVEEWWKQFGGLKGVVTITEFTNSQGTKGYRAKYIGSSTDDVFFEVKEPHFVIHLSSGVLDKAVFDAVSDSVAWNK